MNINRGNQLLCALPASIKNKVFLSRIMAAQQSASMTTRFSLNLNLNLPRGRFVDYVTFGTCKFSSRARCQDKL